MGHNERDDGGSDGGDSDSDNNNSIYAHVELAKTMTREPLSLISLHSLLIFIP